MNWRAVYRRHLFAGSQIVAVVSLVDLRRHLRFESAAQGHRGYRRFANDREFICQHLLLLLESALGILSRPSDNYERSPMAAACCSISRRAFVSSTMVSSIFGATDLRAASQGMAASPMESTLM